MLSNKKGLAMSIVIAIILALLSLTGAAILISLSHLKTSSYQLKRARAFYVAEAGIQRVLWMCRTGNLPAGYDLTGPLWPIPDSITFNYPEYSLTVNMEIHEQGRDPLGTGMPPPPDTYPIIVTVNY